MVLVWLVSNRLINFFVSGAIGHCVQVNSKKKTERNLMSSGIKIAVTNGHALYLHKTFLIGLGSTMRRNLYDCFEVKITSVGEKITWKS